MHSQIDVNDGMNLERWHSVPANDYLDRRRAEYAPDETRGAIIYRRGLGKGGGRVYFSPDCSPAVLAIFVPRPPLAVAAQAR